MEAPLLTAPVFGIQHHGCEGHVVGYCNALRRNKRSGWRNSLFNTQELENPRTQRVHGFNIYALQLNADAPLQLNARVCAGGSHADKVALFKSEPVQKHEQIKSQNKVVKQVRL